MLDQLIGRTSYEIISFLHERELTLRSGAGHNPANKHNNAREHLLFESMTVIVIDDHNGLCDSASRYIGLEPSEATNETERAKRRKVLGDYCDFFTKTHVLRARGLLLFSLP